MEKKPENPNPKKSKPNFNNWAEGACEKGIISEYEFKKIIEEEASKQDRMRDWRLPQLRNYGFFSSVEEIKNKIKPDKNERYIIRCVSKESRKVERLVDVTLDKCCEFAEKLPGGFEKWLVEIKETVQTIASGTIIRESNGDTKIESWRGPHYLSETGPKYIATISSSQGEHHFTWQAPEGASDLREMQEYAMEAMKKISPNLEMIPDDLVYPVYLEYGVKEGGEIYFMDVGDPSLKKL